jgi:hypothetical protein
MQRRKDNPSALPNIETRIIREYFIDNEDYLLQQYDEETGAYLEVGGIPLDIDDDNLLNP